MGSKDGWKTLITKDEPAYELGDGMDVWEMISSEQSKLTYPICNYTGRPFHSYVVCGQLVHRRHARKQSSRHTRRTRRRVT